MLQINLSYQCGSLYNMRDAIDVTINYNGQQFKAHSFVLQHQGGHFSCLFRIESKVCTWHRMRRIARKPNTSNRKGTIVLSLQRTHVHMCSKPSYHSSRPSTTKCVQAIPTSKMRIHVTVYAAADYFDLPSLNENAAI